MTNLTRFEYYCLLTQNHRDKNPTSLKPTKATVTISCNNNVFEHQRLKILSKFNTLTIFHKFEHSSLTTWIRNEIKNNWVQN